MTVKLVCIQQLKKLSNAELAFRVFDKAEADVNLVSKKVNLSIGMSKACGP
jgi:hypothetical protein